MSESYLVVYGYNESYRVDEMTQKELQELLSGVNWTFHEKPPQYDDCREGDIFIMKGKRVLPKPKEVVQEWEF